MKKTIKVIDVDDFIVEALVNACLPEEERTVMGDRLNEEELSDTQKAYREYFQKILDEFDAKSPADLSEEDKKKFFSKVKEGWDKEKGAPK